MTAIVQPRSRQTCMTQLVEEPDPVRDASIAGRWRPRRGPPGPPGRDAPTPQSKGPSTRQGHRDRDCLGRSTKWRRAGVPQRHSLDRAASYKSGVTRCQDALIASCRHESDWGNARSGGDAGSGVSDSPGQSRLLSAEHVVARDGGRHGASGSRPAARGRPERWWTTPHVLWTRAAQLRAGNYNAT